MKIDRMLVSCFGIDLLFNPIYSDAPLVVEVERLGDYSTGLLLKRADGTSLIRHFWPGQVTLEQAEQSLIYQKVNPANT